MPGFVHSRLVRAVYQEHLDHFGEPDASWHYGDGTSIPGQKHFPSRIDVMIWRAQEDEGINTFSTMGMSDRLMAGCVHRAEIHFSLRGRLTEDDERNICTFLANLATYPFHYKTYFDWWQTMRDPSAIPLFSPAMSLLFHPRFVDDGWDAVSYKGLEIRLLNAVPITNVERELIKAEGVAELMDLWGDCGFDKFAVR